MQMVIITFLFLLSKKSSGQNLCTYEIDSLRIILNENIPSFIDSLTKESVVTKNDTKFIPDFIRNSILCWVREFSIANPDEPFQTTDHIFPGKKLARRQLTYLGISEHHIILSYKRGGIALENHILLFKIEGQKILDLWGGPGKEVKSKAEVLRYLKSIVGQKNYGYIVI
jgi:hypothetical protein